MATRKLEVVIAGNAKGATTALGQVEKKASGFGSKMSGIGKGVGLAFATGGAAAAAGVALVLPELINMGTGLDVMRKKVATVFEGSTADVKKWADANNEAFGITDEELAGLAANFGDLVKPMGFSAKQASGMAKDVIGLSGALSAWSGGTRTATEVSEILTKAMLGERDELKGLGISISEADVSARLAAKGQDKLTGSALQQAEAVATQELIFEKSTDAQKAWANGSLDAVKKSNKLKAMFGEMKEALANALLPIVQKVTGWLGENLPKALDKLRKPFQLVVWYVMNAKNQIGNLIGLFKSGEGDSQGFAEIMDNIFGNTGKTVDVFRTLYEVGSKVFGWIKDTAVPAVQNVVKAVGGWKNALKIVGVAIALLVAPFATLAAGLVYAYFKFETFRNVVDGVVSWLINTAWPAIQSFAELIVEGFGVVVAWVQANWPAISEAISHVLNVIVGYVKWFIGNVQLAWRVFGDDILRVAKAAWTFIQSFISTTLRGISAVVKLVTSIINGDWGKAWDAIKQIVSIAWERIKSIISFGVAIVKGILSGAFDAWKRLAGSAVDGIVGFFSGLPGRIVATIGAIGLAAAGVGASIMNGIASGIGAAANFVGSLASKLWGAVKDFINARLDTIREFKASAFGFSIKPFGSLPRLHTGGTYRAPTPGGQGLALLRDGEHVSTPGDRGSGGLTIIVQGSILTERDLADTIRKLQRQGLLPKVA